jgi:hypothetical protein
MIPIVTYAYRYKRPPRKRKVVALEVPAVVKATDPGEGQQARCAPVGRAERNTDQAVG